MAGQTNGDLPDDTSVEAGEICEVTLGCEEIGGEGNADFQEIANISDSQSIVDNTGISLPQNSTHSKVVMLSP